MPDLGSLWALWTLPLLPLLGLAVVWAVKAIDSWRDDRMLKRTVLALDDGDVVTVGPYTVSRAPDGRLRVDIGDTSLTLPAGKRHHLPGGITLRLAGMLRVRAPEG